MGMPHKLDITVPAARMAEFVRDVPQVVAAEVPGATTWLFGHVGDGNLHVNVTGLAEHDESADDAVLRYVASIGGSISAEHGIGTAKKRWLHLNRSPAEIDAMRAIKAALDPGGILNLLPGAGVLALVGAPALLQGIDRLQRDPSSSLDVIGGLFSTGLDVLAHPTVDDWWAERGWRGDANDIPVLLVNGFYDVESRGAFQAYQALRADGAHLVMEGGHDGVPAGTDGGAA